MVTMTNQGGIQVQQQDIIQMLLMCEFEGVENALDVMKALAEGAGADGVEDRDCVLAYEQTALLLGAMGFRVSIKSNGKHVIYVDI